jgi:hypothetical protein
MQQIPEWLVTIVLPSQQHPNIWSPCVATYRSGHRNKVVNFEVTGAATSAMLR